jgi:hypothetical protein
MQANTATFLPGGNGRWPLSNAAAYRFEFATSVSVTVIGFLLL